MQYIEPITLCGFRSAIGKDDAKFAKASPRKTTSTGNVEFPPHAGKASTGTHDPWRARHDKDKIYAEHQVLTEYLGQHAEPSFGQMVIDDFRKHACELSVASMFEHTITDAILKFCTIKAMGATLLCSALFG